ncbi:di-trans,poly-cis-decaprenylcistransferase [Candidatus Micrarchaeota archaeon]|nr:di-trans,poly-cis-decaprenylcistransferase [Candidatus Micrarchaeota archaeon]
MTYPANLAIIPDGNRRFAERNKLALDQAYLQGFAKAEHIMHWLAPTSVKSVKLWALSLENFHKRSSLELTILFELMKHRLNQSLKDSRFDGRDFSVRFIGQTEKLPRDVRDLMGKLTDKSKGAPRELCVAIAYSGQAELAQAAQKAGEDFKAGRIDKIDEAAFSKYLYAQEPVDLVIRTGGVKRLSGFLPWQNAYAEVFFSDKMWPEFGQDDLNAALSFYDQTERRFGK